MSKRLEDTAFFHYYRPLLRKDWLTDEEFKRLVIDWLLGMNYYIVDPVSGSQGSRIILEEIMRRYPKSSFQNKRDADHILYTTVCDVEIPPEENPIADFVIPPEEEDDE